MLFEELRGRVPGASEKAFLDRPKANIIESGRGHRLEPK
jgi:hypothetical protein